MFVACGHISQRQSKRLFKMFLWWKLQTFCWCAGGCEISLHVCWSSLSCLRWKLLDVQRKVQFVYDFLWNVWLVLIIGLHDITTACSYNMWPTAVQQLLVLITISVCTVIAVSSEFLLWGVAHRNWKVSASTGSDVLSGTARALLQTLDQLMAPICCLPAVNKLREEEEARLVALRQQS